MATTDYPRALDDPVILAKTAAIFKAARARGQEAMRRQQFEAAQEGCRETGIKMRLWLKLERGVCHRCGAQVTGATARDFHFHHRDPATKVGTVSTMTGYPQFQEALKCDLLCVGCHKEAHH